MGAFVRSPLWSSSPAAWVPRRSHACRTRPLCLRMAISPRLVQFAGASEFEIRQYLGSLGFKTITDWEYYSKDVSPLAPTRTVEAAGPQVRLYDARCLSRNPRLFNARVLLKEFIYPDGVELGVNEAEAYQKLYETSGTTRIDPDVVPVATLLGSFLADDSFNNPSFKKGWADRFPRSPQPPKPGSPWLVFRWEGNLTAAQFPTRKPSAPLADSFFARLLPKMVDQTEPYLIALMRKSLLALNFLHSAGIVHRSLSSSSLMVNTVDETMYTSLEVKIRDLGFAKPISTLVTTPEDLEKAKKAGAVSPSEISRYFCADDVYMMGYAFCELIFGALSKRDVDASVLPDCSQDRFKSLFEDTFDLSVERFREYCLAEPQWERAVQFLDGPSAGGREEHYVGWDLLRSMLGVREDFRDYSIDDLTNSPLFRSR